MPTTPSTGKGFGWLPDCVTIGTPSRPGTRSAPCSPRADEPREIRFDRSSPAYSLHYRRGFAELFYHWRRNFRAPLLDEYFARGNFSRCRPFDAFEAAPTVPGFPALPSPPILSLPPVPSFPSFADFGGDFAAFLAAIEVYNTVSLPAYQAAVQAVNDAFLAYSAEAAR